MALLGEINEVLTTYPKKHISLYHYYQDKDMLLSIKALLEAIVSENPETGSRGGAVFVSDGKTVPEDEYYRDYVTITEKGNVTFKKTREVPTQDRPFESYLSEMKGG